MRLIKLAKISPIIFLINLIYADNLSSETHTYSLIKIFCKESVKVEFKKNKFEYEESIGEDVCNCYLKNIKKKYQSSRINFKMQIKKIEEN